MINLISSLFTTQPPVDKIRSIKSCWLSDRDKEVGRLASLGITHSSGSLPMLHALELEMAFKNTHHVLVHNESFAEGLITKLIEASNYNSKFNELKKTPYRHLFRLLCTEKKLHTKDSAQIRARLAQKLIEKGKSLQQTGTEMSQLKLNGNTDSRLMDFYITLVNKKLFSETKDLLEIFYLKDYQELSVSRIQDAYDGFIDPAIKPHMLALIDIYYDRYKTEINDLFTSIIQVRDPTIKTGILNVILIPKNSTEEKIDKVFTAQMFSNPNILTVPLSEDSKSFKNAVKERINAFVRNSGLTFWLIDSNFK